MVVVPPTKASVFELAELSAKVVAAAASDINHQPDCATLLMLTVAPLGLVARDRAAVSRVLVIPKSAAIHIRTSLIAPL